MLPSSTQSPSHCQETIRVTILGLLCAHNPRHWPKQCCFLIWKGPNYSPWCSFALRMYPYQTFPFCASKTLSHLLGKVASMIIFGMSPTIWSLWMALRCMDGSHQNIPTFEMAGTCCTQMTKHLGDRHGLMKHAIFARIMELISPVLPLSLLYSMLMLMAEPW